MHIDVRILCSETYSVHQLEYTLHMHASCTTHNAHLRTLLSTFPVFLKCLTCATPRWLPLEGPSSTTVGHWCSSARVTPLSCRSVWRRTMTGCSADNLRSCLHTTLSWRWERRGERESTTTTVGQLGVGGA